MIINKHYNELSKVNIEMNAKEWNAFVAYIGICLTRMKAWDNLNLSGDDLIIKVMFERFYSEGYEIK